MACSRPRIFSSMSMRGCFTFFSSSKMVRWLVRSWCWARYPRVFPLARTASPESAGSSPVIIFNRVDLPAPLMPTMAAFS